METDTARIDALSKRAAHFRKAFAKGIGGKANTLQAAAISRAAVLTARAEQAATDPTCTANDLVRLDHAAALARRDMQRALEGAKAKGPQPDGLRSYLLEKARRAGRAIA